MLSKFNQACFGLDQVFGTQTNSDLCKTKPGNVHGECVVYFITIDIVNYYKVEVLYFIAATYLSSQLNLP